MLTHSLILLDDRYMFLIYVYRSIEEVIAMFISVAFVADALKGTVKSKSQRLFIASQSQNAFWIHFDVLAFPCTWLSLAFKTASFLTYCIFYKCLTVFHKHYHPPTLANGSIEELQRISAGLNAGETNLTGAGLLSFPESFILCTRARPLLCLLLMLGTLWVGYTLYQFKRR